MQEVVIAADERVLVGSELPHADREALRLAVRSLEGPSFAAKLSDLAGRPIELLGRALPERVAGMVSEATASALRQALRLVLLTVPKDRLDPQTHTHRALATLTGALGGAFGLAALPVELPVSTTIMLRAIARIAQSEGEDLRDPEAALACLQVFALAGRTGHLHESGYFAARAAMARSVVHAVRQVAERGLIDETSSAMIRLLAQIGTRFGVTVSQKAAAQAVPVLGAVSGAAINAAFTHYFQSLAKGHFTVRRLERQHGKAAVRRAYDQIMREEGLAGRPS